MFLFFIKNSLKCYNKFKYLFISKFNYIKNMSDNISKNFLKINKNVYEFYFNIFNNNYQKNFINYNDYLLYLYNNHY